MTARVYAFLKRGPRVSPLVHSKAGKELGRRTYPIWAMLALLLHGALAVSPGDPITTGCKSISPLHGDGDTWCTKNCAVGNCPPTICECSGDEQQAAVPGVQAPAPEAEGVQAPAPVQIGVQAPAPLPLTAEEIEAAADAVQPPAPILVTPKEDAEADASEVKVRAPRKSVNGFAPVISGPWFYCADGVGHERSGKQRSPAFGTVTVTNTSQGMVTNTSRKLPDWLASSSRSGNSVSLAFMNPLELGDTPDHGVPDAFVEYTAMLRKGENRDRQIFFSIGGQAFQNLFEFLSSKAKAEKAGAQACIVARRHGVGIEIDHESTKGHDVERLRDFIKGFRAGCPMGKHLLSMDVMGGPGGAGIGWGPAAVKELVPPTGSPSDTPPEDGDWLDFVNVMVIDSCSSATCSIGFWEQWNSDRFYTSLNFKRATFSFAGGGAFGMCDQAESDMVREAWAWASEREAYGLRAWCVGTGPGGDWDTKCDNEAPGFQAMCAAVGICEPPAPRSPSSGHKRSGSARLDVAAPKWELSRLGVLQP